MSLEYLSTFSGIEAASAAWHPLGFKPIGFSEIEKFPSAVLAHRFPHVPNHGDITQFRDWPNAAFNLLVGGSPCQSFSIAGLRKGLDDPRGNLMLTYLAVAAKHRPEWVLWENVPGVLSSNQGRDFASFVGGLAELGYGWAYRVLDAQYVRVDGFGRAVPQRRRRVFVVGCLGGWARAAAVLFDAASLRGDSAPRRETWERPAPTLSARTQGGGGLGTDGGLTAAPTLRSVGHSESHANAGGQLAVAFDLRGREGGAMPEGPHETANIRAASGGSSRSYVAFAQNTRDEVRLQGGDGRIAGALAAEPGMKQSTYLAYAIQERAVSENLAAGPQGSGIQEGVAYTLEARNKVQSVASQWAVRRLTPRECERLQGFPDGWTDVPYRGKPAADGPRYKALGNSMAVNVMRWIGWRIKEVHEGRL